MTTKLYGAVPSLQRPRPAAPALRIVVRAGGVVALFALAWGGCSPRPAIVRCHDTGTLFDAPGGARAARVHVYFKSHVIQADNYELPVVACSVEWLP